MRSNTYFKFILPIIMASAMGSSVAAEDGDSERLDIDDLMALKSVGSPVISPDGDWVAYTVRTTDVEADKSSSRIFIVSTDGETVIPMTAKAGSASAPQWSPDGRYLSFIASRGGEEAKSQVWTLDRRGGEAQAYTKLKQGVRGYRWSPDGSRMLLVIRDQSEVELERAAAKEAGEDVKDRPRPWVIDRLQFKRDRVGYLDRTRNHLYVVDGRMGAPLQLTFGDFEDSAPRWRPDGAEIAFVSNRTEEPDANENSDIFIVSALGDAEMREARQLTTNPGQDSAPSWSHDGSLITYTADIQPELIWYATNHLAVIPATGGEAQLLTQALDRNVSAPVFTADDSAILFGLEDSAERHLARYDLSSGAISRPIEGNISLRGFDLHASGSVAAMISSAHLPGEVHLLRDGALSQLTDTNHEVLAPLKLAEVLNVTFPSADGTEIEGFIFTPPDYQEGQRYPTILRIHGGPVAQYDFSFNTEAQLFAANGYVVVLTNPRGSSGYGRDFSMGIYQSFGVNDTADVLAGVDYAIAEGFADADKLGVGGWSYGGILTDYVITQTTRFKAATTGASFAQTIANYGVDHYQRQWVIEYGTPWENHDLWESIASFNDIGNVTTPTLVMGGEVDWNVPIINSEQIYQALKQQGVDTQLVVYPGQSHGIRRPSFIRDRLERYLAWYAKYLKVEADTLSGNDQP